MREQYRRVDPNQVMTSVTTGNLFPMRRGGAALCRPRLPDVSGPRVRVGKAPLHDRYNSSVHGNRRETRVF